MAELTADLSLFRRYREARRLFLAALDIDSCRDPLAEFAERIVCQQIGGRLAESRVQPGYDLTSPDGRRVQVKYLANPAGKWRNEHDVRFSKDVDDYAVVFFEDLELRAIFLFRRDTFDQVAAALAKRKYANPERGLTLTQKNFQDILRRGDEFERSGVRCFVPAVS